MEPIRRLARLTTVGDEQSGMDRFDEYAAEQRAYWQALRDGEALTPEAEAEALRQETEDQVWIDRTTAQLLLRLQE